MRKYRIMGQVMELSIPQLVEFMATMCEVITSGGGCWKEWLHDNFEEM